MRPGRSSPSGRCRGAYNCAPMREQDFLLSGYQRLLLRALDAGYAFVSYADLGRESAERSCLLRHDVDAVLRGEILIEGLVNTYNRQQMGPYFYVSDTNMHWRTEHPEIIFERRMHPCVQLLIHPLWWTERPLSMEHKWLEALRGHDAAV